MVLTIDYNISASDIPTSAATKHDERSSQLVRLSQATKWCSFLPGLKPQVCCRLRQPRVHKTRADSVDSDTVLRPFGRKRLAEVYETCFGGVICGLPEEWKYNSMPRDGGDENDTAALLLLDQFSKLVASSVNVL